MNQIPQEWKSQSEFVRERPYSDAELKKFQHARPLTRSIIGERKTEFLIVVQLINDELQRRKPNIFISSSAITKDVIEDPIKKEVEKQTEGLTAFQKYLLSWPEMSDEEYNYVQEKRKHFNEWK